MDYATNTISSSNIAWILPALNFFKFRNLSASFLNTRLSYQQNAIACSLIMLLKPYHPQTLAQYISIFFMGGDTTIMKQQSNIEDSKTAKK
jgi:hypothetical protein